MKIQTTKVYSEVAKAVADGYRTISAQGSARSSKTYNITIFLCVYLLSHPGYVLSVMRKTLPALKGSVMRDFIDVLGRLGVWNPKSFNKSELIYTMPNSSFIEFFSTDDEQKLRGRKRHIAYINEANELLEVEYKQIALRTTEFIFMDYNPSFTGEHWIVSVNKAPSTYHFITTYKDNPFLEQTIIDEIEALQFTSPSLWQIYGLGQQAVVEGLVFPKFETCDTIADWCQQYVGVDFGYTHDPTAIVTVGYGHNASGQECLYIDEVVYQTHMSTGDICAALRPYSNWSIAAESADPRLIDEIQRSGVRRITPVKKGVGSIEAGIARMQTMQLYVTNRSVNVMKELRNYVYARGRDGKWLNVPVDTFNHAIDAVRYVVLNELMRNKRVTIW